jgi:hypothetical protein
MTCYKVSFLLIVIFPAAVVANAQDPHVHSEYKEQLKATIVYTDKMYILNTPEQVIDAEFNFRLKQKKSRKQPDRVDLLLWSYSRALKYQKDKDRNTILITNGNPIKIDKVIYMPLQAVKKDFERIKDAYAEWIILYLNPEEAKKLATAKDISLQVGSQELNFTDDQVNAIRDFASRIPTQ